MRNTFALITVLTSGVVLNGCDQQAAQNAAQQDLEAALLEIKAAEIGYVPTADTGQGVWAYRDAALDKATPALNKVLQSGTPEQQVVAARQLAMINLSGARYQAREALAANAEVAAQSASLLRHADAVAQAAALVQDLSVSGTDAVDKLEAQISQTQNAIDEGQKKAGALREQIEEHQSNADLALSNSRAAQAKAADAQARAFVTEGDTHFDALDEAADLQRAAQKASTESDGQNARIDELSRELTIVQTGIDGGDETVKSLQQRIAAIMDRDAVVNEERGLAEEQLSETAAVLMQQFREVTGRFSNEVDAPLDSARLRVTDALSVLDRVQPSARGAAANALAGDRVTALGDNTYLLIEQAAANDSLARILGALNGVADTLPAESAGRVRDAYEKTVAKRDQLVGEAKAAAESAKTAADALNDEAASAQSEQITAFEQRITELN